MFTIPTMVQGLTDSESEMFTMLRQRLFRKRSRNILRTQYYEGRNRLVDIGYSLPPVAKDINIVVGWAEKAVEVLANRIILENVRTLDGSRLNPVVDQIVKDNSLYSLAHQAHTSALIHSCAFVACFQGDESAGEPRAVVQTFTADHATGVWDSRLKGLSSALLVDVADDDSEQVRCAYLMCNGMTVTFAPENRSVWRVADRQPYVGRIPVELLAYRPDDRHPFGRSRISRTVMSLTDSAVRTFLRSEMQAELYSIPPRYILGAERDTFTDGNGEMIPKWRLLLDQMLILPSDVNGEKPTVGSFPQYSFEPHIQQLRNTAAMFAAATSVPPDEMGVLTDNPSSAEAIDKAQKELCLLAESCQTRFAPCWEHILATAQRIHGVEPEDLAVGWRAPSVPSRSAAADACIKLVQSGVLPVDSDVTYDMLDLSDMQRRQLRSEQAKARAAAYIQSMLQQSTTDTGNGNEVKQ